MAGQDHPQNNGEWQFEYFSRLCVWKTPYESCSNKSSPTEQKTCCQEQNKNSPTLPCAGEWDLNSEKGICEYSCSEKVEVTKRRPPDEIAQTSQYCTNTYNNKNDQSLCCDAFLKHPLSIGPRAGFPDCIGK